ncbi:MAG: hypothetical protein ACX931_16725 [Saccharospirillum sp.]
MMNPTRWMLALLALPTAVLPAESRLSGNMQVQAAYGAESSDASERWSVATPNTWLGIEVTETLPASRFKGVWQFELDALAEVPEARTRQMYLEWQQPLYQVRAGRMATLEQTYLLDPVTILNGLQGGGTAGGNHTEAFAARAFQVDVSDGETAFAALELGLDEPGDDVSIRQWALAGGLDTPEGQLVFSYRSNEDADEAGLWGLGINWFQDSLALGVSYLYQSETLAWDLSGRYQAGSVVSKLAYGRDAIADAGYWSLGFDQRFTPALRHYTELRWQVEEDLWRFQTGFRLSF